MDNTSYYSALRSYGRAARSVRELKGFERVTLHPGETRTLRFAIPAAARRYWSAADRVYVLDESDFDIWVGGTSTVELHAGSAVRASASGRTLARTPVRAQYTSWQSAGDLDYWAEVAKIACA